ncbi:MAG: isoprenylcysteine carboxylmethyltransferase family protein [Nitratireductor sp.]|nr:isoprenylcysteine carboxylmethyltransferase family protein [Nitratireductor sp.]MCB1455380.1 isoprenylcysteine carboxylmethyltransferase family protein [Nitratireductor sp.]
MKNTDETPNTIPWPPIILLLSIALGWLAGHYYPLPWAGTGMARDILQGIGIIAILVAVLIYAAAFHAMRRVRTNILPHRAADHLVTDGPFAFSRNPIYLANFILVTGLGLALANLWLPLAAILAAWLEQKLGIEREEAHLEHKFGKAWRDYRKRVRRWI